jgi:hypothetical protein
LIANLDEGVEDPIPMFPFARTERKEVPDDEATWNGFKLEVDVACTLKAKDADVALIPVKEPLSRSDEVPRVVEVNQRVAYPNAPPVIDDAAIAREEVDTQRVDVPTD